jgi:hypothetical protein
VRERERKRGRGRGRGREGEREKEREKERERERERERCQMRKKETSLSTPARPPGRRSKLVPKLISSRPCMEIKRAKSEKTDAKCILLRKTLAGLPGGLVTNIIMSPNAL